MFCTESHRTIGSHRTHAIKKQKSWRTSGTCITVFGWRWVALWGRVATFYLSKCLSNKTRSISPSNSILRPVLWLMLNISPYIHQFHRCWNAKKKTCSVCKTRPMNKRAMSTRFKLRIRFNWFFQCRMSKSEQSQAFDVTHITSFNWIFDEAIVVVESMIW